MRVNRLFVPLVTALTTLLFYMQFAPQKVGFDYRIMMQSARNLISQEYSYFDTSQRHPAYLSKLSDQQTSVANRATLIRAGFYDGIQFHFPLGAIFFVPFAPLSDEAGFRLYTIVQCVLLWLSVLTLWKILEHSSKYLDLIVPIFFVFFCLIPNVNEAFVWNLFWGQTNLIALFAVSIFLFCLKRSYPFWAGCILSLAVIDKVVPILALIVCGRILIKRTLLGLAAGLLCLGCVGLILFGSKLLLDLSDWPIVVGYSHYNLAQSLSTPLNSPFNYSLNEFASSLGSLILTYPILRYCCLSGAVLLIIFTILASSPFWLLISALLAALALLTDSISIFLYFSLLTFLIGIGRHYWVTVRGRISLIIRTSLVLLVGFPALMGTYLNHHVIYEAFGAFLIIVSYLCRRSDAAGLILTLNAGMLLTFVYEPLHAANLSMAWFKFIGSPWGNTILRPNYIGIMVLMLMLLLCKPRSAALFRY